MPTKCKVYLTTPYTQAFPYQSLLIVRARFFMSKPYAYVKTHRMYGTIKKSKIKPMIKRVHGILIIDGSYFVLHNFSRTAQNPSDRGPSYVIRKCSSCRTGL